MSQRPELGRAHRSTWQALLSGHGYGGTLWLLLAEEKPAEPLRERGGGGGETPLLSNLNSNPLNKESGISSWYPLAVWLVKASLSFLRLWRGRWQLVTAQ